jgi:membrane-bound lytic murein transglycosylase D
VAALGVEGGKEGVPMELNREVLLNINYFLNNARGFMTRSLNRGSKYIPMMKAIFRQKGLPEDLVYLALIESGFQTAAVSRAAAVGPWQFIASTGRRYGLTIDDYVDERMDPVKSTYAAADYLTALHDMFSSWPLAIAAYNSGEGKILRGMKNYGVSNFWDMSDVNGHLAAETRLYVPSFLAATFIAKDPGAYGLEIEAQPPDQWDEAVVPEPIRFDEAARMAGTTTERLEELNPHLKKKATPPDEADFVLRIPMGTLNNFAAAYEKSGRETIASRAAVSAGDSDTRVALAERKRAAALAAAAIPDTFPGAARARQSSAARGRAAAPHLFTITHKVQPGDTLAKIASLYGVSVNSIRNANLMNSSAVYRGQILRIQSDLPLTAASPAKGRSRVLVVKSKTPAAATGSYIVRKGDTLMGIAGKSGMSARELADLNNIRGVTIRAGQKLAVRGGARTDGHGGQAVHTVARGETLGTIAEKYKMSLNDLRRLNNIKGTNITVGQKLTLRAAPPAEKPAPKAGKGEPPRAEAAGAAIRAQGSPHTVADGETIYSIARKHHLTTEQLLALNPKLSGVNIRPGQKIAVSGAAPAASAGPEGPVTYRAASGDTLYSIAARNKMTVEALKILNDIKDDTVRLGQTLKLR